MYIVSYTYTGVTNTDRVHGDTYSVQFTTGHAFAVYETWKAEAYQLSMSNITLHEYTDGRYIRVKPVQG